MFYVYTQDIDIEIDNILLGVTEVLYIWELLLHLLGAWCHKDIDKFESQICTWEDMLGWKCSLLCCCWQLPAASPINGNSPACSPVCSVWLQRNHQNVSIIIRLYGRSVHYWGPPHKGYVMRLLVVVSSCNTFSTCFAFLLERPCCH